MQLNIKEVPDVHLQDDLQVTSCITAALLYAAGLIKQPISLTAIDRLTDRQADQSDRYGDYLLTLLDEGFNITAYHGILNQERLGPDGRERSLDYFRSIGDHELVDFYTEAEHAAWVNTTVGNANKKRDCGATTQRLSRYLQSKACTSSFAWATQ